MRSRTGSRKGTCGIEPFCEPKRLSMNRITSSCIYSGMNPPSKSRAFGSSIRIGHPSIRHVPMSSNPVSFAADGAPTGRRRGRDESDPLAARQVGAFDEPLANPYVRVAHQHAPLTARKAALAYYLVNVLT